MNTNNQNAIEELKGSYYGDPLPQEINLVHYDKSVNNWN